MRFHRFLDYFHGISRDSSANNSPTRSQRAELAGSARSHRAGRFSPIPLLSSDLLCAALVTDVGMMRQRSHTALLLSNLSSRSAEPLENPQVSCLTAAQEDEEARQTVPALPICMRVDVTGVSPCDVQGWLVVPAKFSGIVPACFSRVRPPPQWRQGDRYLGLGTVEALAPSGKLIGCSPPRFRVWLRPGL